MVELTHSPIDFTYCYEQVNCSESGAICIFSGNVRQGDCTQRLLYILYEAYEKAAKSELNKIIQEIKKRFPIKKIFITHRIGKVLPKECSLLVLVASPHRKESFIACELIITNIKNSVPIWKKEVFENQENWSCNV